MLFELVIRLYVEILWSAGHTCFRHTSTLPHFDKECTVSFSHYGSGTLGGEPASINFQDGLNKRPWWQHLESYCLRLMNFGQRAVWFMIPDTWPMSSSYIDHILLHFCAMRTFGLSFALDLLCRVIVFKLNLWYGLEKKNWECVLTNLTNRNRVLSSANKVLGLCLTMVV